MPTVLLCLLLVFSLGASAQVADGAASAAPAAPAEPAEQPEQPEQPAAADDGIVDMEALVVSGIQPGPGLWKVSRDGRVLWILGTVAPLPRRMQWMSDEVEGIVAASQEVLDPPSMAMRSGLGTFRSLLLVPSLLKARRNPDGLSLEESVPAEIYARWVPLKARYLGRNRGVERWRPLFAAQELYEAAIRRSGMTLDGVVAPVVERAAKRHRVPRTPVQLAIVVDDPKDAIREFNEGPLADTDCFERTLARIETDLDAMRERANAWALGDIAALRAAPYDEQYVVCIRAITETGLARRLGMENFRRQLGDLWLEAAEAALARNASTFASLPVSTLVREDGLLARLQARGYAVEEP
ncbi:TraB/GumN family protein [Luteimonas sp. SJ-92]|uniref:TraB/GumN family protein n=1 Tax=Luteimonas salinisoli TaxID=2752307 RepID=A0A853JCI4_9GAMM|nr:TraB/GumN family protein [Luteimonas salinisoli]NZA26339.1 TraB/GumN family protein [Luteimonas salinisoli]